MKRSELEGMIRTIVQEEFKVSVKKYINAYVPIVISEVVSELVEKKLLEATQHTIKPELHQQVLKEIEEDWPMVGNKPLTSMDTGPGKLPINREKMANLIGYGDVRSQVENSLLTRESSDGNAIIPIDPNSVPVEVRKAMNKDYRGFLKKMNAITDQNRRGI